jgi:MFS family permease
MIRQNRNYYAFLWHAAFFALTTAFTDINTVLPALVLKAGGTAGQVGMLTAIMVGTPLLGQLLFASFLHLRDRKKGFLLLGINLRVLALGVAAFVILGASDMQTGRLVPLVFVLMFSFALAGAFASVSYTDILGKSLLPEQRSRFFVRRQVIMSVAFLISAPAARMVMARLGYPINYTWMFALAAMLLLFASAGFWMIDEPRRKPATNVLSVRDVLRSIPSHLRENPGLRRYILLVNLTGFGLTAMPFYIAFAADRYGLTGKEVGTYLLVQIMGMIVSNYVWAKLVKRYGFTGVVRGCIVCGASLPILAVLLINLPLEAFLVVFFMMGVGISARKIAFEGLFIEITTDQDRALHQGIAGAASLTTALFPLVAGSLILAVGYVPVFLGVSALVASAWLTTGTTRMQAAQ